MKKHRTSNMEEGKNCGTGYPSSSLFHGDIARENQGLNEGSRLNCYTKPLVKKWADPLRLPCFTTGNFMNFVAHETVSLLVFTVIPCNHHKKKKHPKSTSSYLGSCERLDQVKGLGWSDDDDVEVLLKNLGRRFAKKRRRIKTSYSGYIYLYMYIYIYKYPSPFVGEFYH